MAGGAGAGAGKEDRERENGPPTCANTQTALTTPLMDQPAWLSRDHATARQTRRTMNDELKETIDQLANSLQTVTLLATRLRRDLAESMQQAIDLEAGADNAVRAIKRLQTRDTNNH
jgi:hypothetical protein